MITRMMGWLVFGPMIVLASVILLFFILDPVYKLYIHYQPDSKQIQHDAARYSVDLAKRVHAKDSEALFYASNMSYHGIATEQDNGMAKDLLELSAMSGYLPARREYARRIFRGDICVPENTDSMCLLIHKPDPSDEEKKLIHEVRTRQKDFAMKVLRSTGFADNGWSAYYYGQWISLYPFSDEEVAEAINLLEEAANKGNAMAMMLLAQYYHDGKFVKKNPGRYFRLMKRVADLGYERGRLAVAKCLVLGYGTPRDIAGGLEICKELMVINYPLADAFVKEAVEAGIIDKLPHVKRRHESEFPKWPNREELGRFVANFSPSMQMVCAARDGDWPMVKQLLLEKDANVDEQDFIKYTALHYALKQKDYQATWNLLQYGANPNLRGFKGVMPLNLAARAGQEFVALLLDFGADPVLSHSVGTVASCQDPELFIYCLEKYDLLSPDVFSELTNIRDDKVIDLYLAKIKNVNAKSHYGRTYMYMAANGKRMDIADKLVTMGFENRKLYEAAKQYIRERKELEEWEKANPVPPFTNPDYNKRFEITKRWLENAMKLE